MLLADFYCIFLDEFRHRSILDYLYTSGLRTSYDALKRETGLDEFQVDPKGRQAGLLEKKWTSVIRLQKKVRQYVGQNLIGRVLEGLEYGREGRVVGNRLQREDGFQMTLRRVRGDKSREWMA